MDKIKKIIKQAIDIHVHIGPEVIPRKYNVKSLIKAENGKIGGLVLKNHFNVCEPYTDKSGLRLFGSVVLNNSVGGLNPDVITKDTSIVWLPTVDAKNFLRKSKYQIPCEWVNNKKFIPILSKDIIPIEIGNIGNILEKIKKLNLVLATGHISWQESIIVVNKALGMGINKIVITHPIYQKINMPIKIQKQLATKGCFIEECYSMYSIDKISINKIARQIKYIGADRVILSSDVGQVFSPSPSEALYKFAKLLRKEGIKRDDLYKMLVSNPRSLL